MTQRIETTTTIQGTNLISGFIYATDELGRQYQLLSDQFALINSLSEEEFNDDHKILIGIFSEISKHTFRLIKKLKLSNDLLINNQINMFNTISRMEITITKKEQKIATREKEVNNLIERVQSLSRNINNSKFQIEKMKQDHSSSGECKII